MSSIETWCHRSNKRPRLRGMPRTRKQHALIQPCKPRHAGADVLGKSTAGRRSEIAADQPRNGSWTRLGRLSSGALARERTRQACACKNEQRRQRARGRPDRVRSALTQRVNAIGAKNYSSCSFHDDHRRSTAVSRFKSQVVSSRLAQAGMQQLWNRQVSGYSFHSPRKLAASATKRGATSFSCWPCPRRCAGMPQFMARAVPSDKVTKGTPTA